MLNESAYERIRRAYHVEKKSINRIVQEMGYSRPTITKIVNQPSPKPYQLTCPRSAPVFGPYQHRIKELLRQNEHLPPTS